MIYNPITLVDGIEHKHCNKCDETKPIDPDFYDYREHGGTILSQCKDCIRLANAERWMAQNSKDAEVLIKYIRSRARSQRHNVLYSLVEEKKITRTQFKVIVREVSF